MTFDCHLSITDINKADFIVDQAAAVAAQNKSKLTFFDSWTTFAQL